MQRWWVALATEPERKLVEVLFRRPWYCFGLRSSVSIRPCEPAGEPWAAAVELALDVDMLWDPRSRKFAEPPHTGSARRVELALSTLRGRSPLVGYRDTSPPPLPAAPRPKPPAAQGEFVTRLHRTLSTAEAAGWGGPEFDCFEWTLQFQKAEDLAELVGLAMALRMASHGRPGLRSALDSMIQQLREPWADGEFGERLRAALEQPR